MAFIAGEIGGGDGLYLVVTWGDVEPEVVSGPHNDLELENALIELVKSEPENFASDIRDGIYKLEIKDGRPRMASFSGGYMERVRIEAGFPYLSEQDPPDYVVHLKQQFPLIRDAR